MFAALGLSPWERRDLCPQPHVARSPASLGTLRPFSRIPPLPSYREGCTGGLHTLHAHSNHLAADTHRALRCCKAEHRGVHGAVGVVLVVTLGSFHPSCDREKWRSWSRLLASIAAPSSGQRE